MKAMIRNAVPNDFEAVLCLMEQLEQQSFSPTDFQPIFQELLQNPAHVILVAQGEQGVVGMLHLRMEMQLHHVSKIAEIIELAVLDSHRSQGIGGQLVQTAIETAKACDCTQIEVTSNRIRERAHAFYQRLGMCHTHVKLTMAL